MVRITEEIRLKMIEMRESGATYPQIMETLGVTKERCMAYLKDIKSKTGYIDASTNDWIQAEKEAKDILSTMGFCYVHNLNEISSTIASWDYLAQKGEQWWLIDVTVNSQKGVSVKKDVTVDGYEHAILLKNTKGWKLIKIIMDVEFEIPF